ncbi:MAG: hypothetical protein U1D30_25985 [Planctomycetota bacterium]
MTASFAWIGWTVIVGLATVGIEPSWPLWRMEVSVQFGEDRGQNFGTLFETTSTDKDVVLGAGFLGAYNTLVRSERRVVHFFVRDSRKENAESMARLPRPTEDSGVYLFDVGNQLFETSAAEGRDPGVRTWDFKDKEWKLAPDTDGTTMLAGNGVLQTDSRSIRWNNQNLLTLKAEEGVLDKPYFAEGTLFFRLSYPKPAGRVARLAACALRVGETKSIDWATAKFFNLATPGEFIYAYGQWNGDVVVATNLGGVYRWAGGKWSVVRSASPGVSFQVYAMINYRDRLLLGQYPTGHLFEYCDGKIEELEGFPPRLEGVSKYAREAQTLAIYNGELYVGVWPWGEIWKFRSETSTWSFVGRAFTHPEVTDQEQHPYQRETTAVDPVINQWGQRITSLVPCRGSLFVGTSAKSSRPFDKRFAFLAPEKWQEYGSVLEMTLPGQASGFLQWSNGPTSLTFEIHADHLLIRQDGQTIGRSAFDARGLKDVAFPPADLGKGVFGPFAGQKLAVVP